MEQLKRILALVLCLVMCFAVVACDSKKSNSDDDESEESSSNKDESNEDCVHEWGEEESDNKKPCTKETEVTRTCKLCETEEVVKVIPATGHALDYETGKCKVCGKKAKSSCDHEECTWVTIQAATCTESGFENEICDDCDFIQDTNYLYSLGHDYEYHEYKDATCTEPGNYGYDTCTRCDYSEYEDEIIPALGHSYIAGVCKNCSGTNEAFTMIQSSADISAVYNVEASAEVPYTAVDAVISTQSGNIASTNQKDTYSFTATNDGVVRVWVSEVYSGVRFSLYAYDNLGDTKGSNTWAYNNDGFTFTAVAGQTYTLSVNGSSGTSAYVLNIGEPKASVDITAYNKVIDKTEYAGQEIIYTYTPAVSGKYNFAFTEIISGSELNVCVKNYLGEEVCSNSWCGNNEDMSGTLTAGETYTIHVNQRSGVTNFNMSIGVPREVIDITSYTAVNDAITYSNQVNAYTFTAPSNGQFYFSLSEMTSDTDVYFEITNYLGETVAYNNWCGNGDSVSAEMVAGQTYTLYITYRYDLTNYTINVISSKDPIPMSSNNGYKDSFILDNQTNVYTFTATAEGDHIVAISGMSNENGYIDMEIKDSNGDYVDYDYYVYNNEYLVIEDVKVGDVYTINVAENSGLIDYTISVEVKN